MASKRAQRRRGCDGKLRFKDRDEAIRRITKIWNDEGRPATVNLNAYRCRFCNGYHIGHRFN